MLKGCTERRFGDTRHECNCPQTGRSFAIIRSARNQLRKRLGRGLEAEEKEQMSTDRKLVSTVSLVWLYR
jgi:hypothetical protein